MIHLDHPLQDGDEALVMSLPSLILAREPRVGQHRANFIKKASPIAR